MSLECELGKRGEFAVIRLSGRIDREAAGILESAHAAASVSDADTVELDFSGVDYINSTGIALIVAMLAKARARKQVMRAIGLTEHYQHIFEITRLSDFIEIVSPIRL